MHIHKKHKKYRSTFIPMTTSSIPFQLLLCIPCSQHPRPLLSLSAVSVFPLTTMAETHFPKSYGDENIGLHPIPREIDRQATSSTGPPQHAWYDPRGWSLRKKLIAGIICVAAIIGIIVGAVEGSKARRYPDYAPLDYHLVDKYSGPSFFNQFDYFSDEDPTNGFVQYVLRPLFTLLYLVYFLLTTLQICR